MRKDEEKTPVPIGVSNSIRIDKLEDRTKDLEEGQGKLAGDIGNINKRVKSLEEERDTRESDRPSNAQFSLSPTGARAKFQNISAWAIVGAIVIVALMFAILALILGK